MTRWRGEKARLGGDILTAMALVFRPKKGGITNDQEGA